MATVTTRTRKSTSKPADTFSLALAISHVVYSVETIPPGEDNVRAFRLCKHAADGQVYDVAQGKDGINRCDCPDYECRYVGTLGMCKHLRAACAMGLIDAPSWTGPAPVEKPEPKRVVAMVADEFGPEVRDDEPAHVQAEGGCCLPSEPSPCVACVAEFKADAPAVEPDRKAVIANLIDPLLSLPWQRPAVRVVEKAPSKPVGLPARPTLPDAGTYSLAELADAQAAFYAGLGNAVGELFAATMRELASKVRMVKASSVAEYEDRIQAADHARDQELMAAAWDRGYAEAIADGNR